jgi:hypothetical protein
MWLGVLKSSCAERLIPSQIAGSPEHRYEPNWLNFLVIVVHSKSTGPGKLPGCEGYGVYARLENFIAKIEVLTSLVGFLGRLHKLSGEAMVIATRGSSFSPFPSQVNPFWFQDTEHSACISRVLYRSPKLLASECSGFLGTQVAFCIWQHRLDRRM